MAARVAALDEAGRRAFYAGLSRRELEALPFHWPFWARPDQLPPPGDWRTWLLLGGRGAGKTRTAAETVRAEAESGRRRHVAILGPTADAVRRVQVEGPSGILAVSPPWARPVYEPSVRRITWPNGAVAHTFSSEEPDRLRGLNADFAWSDELCSWSDPEASWTMLQMALRLAGPLGHPPASIVTTTPRNIPVLRSILASPSTVTSRSRTSDNMGNLDPSTVAFLQERYGGTSLGRQELDAELIADSEGALWSRALLDATRVRAAPAELKRVVVAIDPAGGSGRNSDETGIVVAARDAERHGYVVADLSGKHSPDGWARRAIDAYRRHRADRIVAEQNFGGAMVEATLRAVDPSVPVKLVHASRGKAVRAEPVVALFEQGRAHVVGSLPQLEDQLCGWNPLEGGPSPDRLDAMVWAVSELLVEPQPQPARRIHIPWMAR